MTSQKAEEDPRITALFDMIGRTGANFFQLRWHDDQEPVVWLALAGFKRDGRVVFDVGAGMAPLQAVYRLSESLIDGGLCTHCGRPSGVSLDPAEVILDEVICWYRYSDASHEFVRDCIEEFPDNG